MRRPDARPLPVVVGLAAAAALLVVVLSNLLGVGVTVFPVLAGVAAFVALRRAALGVATAVASVVLVLPMLALVIFGAYTVDTLVR